MTATTDAPEVTAEELELAFYPTSRQLALWKAVAATPRDGLSIVGYGGAMGGGKTRALAELAFSTALAFPGTRILVARLRYSDLMSTTMAEFMRRCPPGAIFSRRQSPPESVTLHRTDSGQVARSTIHFRHLTDWSGLGSQEYGAVFVDEAGEVPEDAARMLLTRLRHPAQPKRYFVAASNPWPGWFERWFIRRELPVDGLDEAGVRLEFIPARIRDNPWLPPNYEAAQRLLLPDDWVDRFVEGKFDSFLGLVYGRFDRVGHRWEGELPPFARYVGGLDFGGPAEHHHMTAGILAGLTDMRADCGPDVLIRLDEFEDRGSAVFERLERWMRHWQQRLRSRIHWRADRSQMAWIDSIARRGATVNPSHGGPHSVNAGIDLVQRRLKWGQDGQPRSYYVATMRQFPERMATYHWAPPTEQDGPTPTVVKRDDDLMDADRYMHEEAERGRLRGGMRASVPLQTRR